MAPTSVYIDAACMLDRLFEEEGIEFGIMGGVALIIMGYQGRSTKDLDLVAHCTKERVIHVMSKIAGMTSTRNMRNDMASFTYSRIPYPSADVLLIECFLSTSLP